MAVEPRHITIERRVRFAVLEPRVRPATEIWFALHGYHQLAHRFLRYFQPIHEGARCIVAPEGLHRHYVDHESRKVGASWMTSEDRLTDIEDYVGYLDRLHAHVLAEESRQTSGGAAPPANRRTRLLAGRPHPLPLARVRPPPASTARSCGAPPSRPTST